MICFRSSAVSGLVARVAHLDVIFVVWLQFARPGNS